MKMKNLFSLKALSIAAVLSITLLYSCKKDSDSINSTDSQTANSESVSASTSSESADMGNSIMSNSSNTQLSSTRVSTIYAPEIFHDRRLLGATITIVGSIVNGQPKGTITIDYGSTTGVTTDGITRKGKITIAYTGWALHPGSTRSITFSNFSRNNVQVSGSYNVTITDSTKTATDIIVTSDHVTALTLTFADQTTIVRNATFTAVWDYNINTSSMSTVTHKAGGSATGTTRLGKEYTMSITKDIVYRADCWASGHHLPISGTKVITVVSTGRVYTIDFGTTTCDDTITVTVGGKTYTITVSASGN